MKTVAIALATTLWAAACASRPPGPPDIVLDQSACSHCGMLISERVYAAALRTSDGREQVFDDIGCLLAAVRKQALTDARFWFHDAASGAWVDGSTASFVTSSSIRSPMAGGTLAFADRAAAERSASQLKTSVVPSLAALLAQKGNSQ